MTPMLTPLPRMFRQSGVAPLLFAALALLLAGCSSNGISLTKRIDYKSASSTPSLELPPDLTTPKYDDRYQVNYGVRSRGGQRRQERTRRPAAHQPGRQDRPRRQRALAGGQGHAGSGVEYRRASSGRTTASSIAVEQPTSGVMETDWAENRAAAPQDFLQRTLGNVADVIRRHVQARQVPDAHRARRRTGHRRDLHFRTRHGTGADDDDRPRRRGVRMGASCRPAPRSRRKC